MNKNEMLKVIIQYLNEKGYNEVGSKLEEESKISLESIQLKNLKTFINSAQYEEAINILLKYSDEKEQIYIIPKIRIRQIFESILQNFNEDKNINIVNQNESIILIRKICNSSNLYEKDSLIQKCSSLIFINNKEDLNHKMKNLCQDAYSKENLIEFIERTLCKSKSLLKSLYPKSLEKMIDNVMKSQIKNCLYHSDINNLNNLNNLNNHTSNTPINNVDNMNTVNTMDIEENEKYFLNKKNENNFSQKTSTKFSYFEDHQCKPTTIPYKCIYSLEKHDEEILNLIPSNKGRFFAAILKSNFIAIYSLSIVNNLNNINDSNNLKSRANSFFEKIEKTEENPKKPVDSKNLQINFITVIKAHENQITSLSWNKNDTLILTSSKDKTIKIFNPLNSENILKIEHTSMISSAIFYDNETKIISSCLSQKINIYSSLTGDIMQTFPSLTINEILFSEKLNFIILVAPTIKGIILYDYITQTEVDKLMINDTIISTSLSKIDGGVNLLINSSNATPVLSLWNLELKNITRKFFGHRQERLNVKCSFGGERENFLLCGSDNKEIFIWHRESSIPVTIINAHTGCVNSIIWVMDIVISSSDDHSIKFWSGDKFDKGVMQGEKENNINGFGMIRDDLSSNVHKRNNMLTNNNIIIGSNFYSLEEDNENNNSEDSSINLADCD